MMTTHRRLHRRPRRARPVAAALTLAAAAVAVPSSARAQIATLDKGHSLLLNNGLQIWGLNTDSFQYNFNYNNFVAANMTAVTWSYGQANAGALSAGQKWGKWIQPDPGQSNYTSPANSLSATESAHYGDLLSIQVGDEQGDLENPSGYTKAWFDAAHTGGYFADKLMYVNATSWNNAANFINFVAAANPDALSFDAYPFGTVGVSPYNWLGKAQFFRRVALGSYIGASGAPARPYGLYLQTYHGGDGARDPSELEMRWQQFTAWTLGYSFADCFTAGGGNTSLFVSGDGNSPNQPYYNNFKESARQSRNLGPALVRLISYGYGPNVVLGKDPSGATNPIPADWPLFNQANAPVNQQYLTSLSAQNTGTKNNGQPGDVYVGFFNPLQTGSGDPAGTAYFMVTNALGAYLQDPTTTVADCQQSITMNFDSQYSGVSTLQRLRRSDGQLEIVPLTRTTARQYNTTISLEGGTGDLFKYNDGSPFVGFNNTLYWDNNGGPGNNNTSTGAGLGGSGTWDGSSTFWNNGSAAGPWTANRDAIFWGNAGVVTVSGNPSVNSLAFKTNGYTLSSGTLTMAGQFITTDSGVSATINTQILGNGGIVKAGAGTLVVANASNSYSGGATVLGGTLQVSADGALGAAPASFTASNIILNGGTLRFGGNFDINNNRGISLGAAGGTIDTQAFTNAAGYNATNGGFQGPGDLTKIGTGTFFAAATSGGLNTTWKGRLIIKQGTWKIVASDGLPYNVPAADGLKADQIILDGGTWQAGANLNITSARRGVTVTANGGTIDTQGFSFSWAGPLAGSSSNSVLTKTGTGTLHLTGASFPSTYAGIVYVIGGTLELNNGISMGDLASIDLGGGNLTVTGNETIGSVGGLGTVTLSSGITLTSGGNNASTLQSGAVVGLGGLTKTGAGTMTLGGANTYAGATSVTGGVLQISQSLTSSSSLSVGAGATARISPSGGTKVLKTGSVNITGNGQLDLKDNRAVLTAQSIGTWNGSAYTGVTGLIAGNGITTTMSAATGGNTLTSLGIATADQTGYAGKTFAGVSVSSGNVLVMYTYAGDANLDGAITGDDYFQIDSAFPQGLHGWFNGDFNYDGVVSGDDYFLIDSNFAAQGAPFPTGGGLVSAISSTAVPEPFAFVTFVASAVPMLLARRRR